MAQSIPIYQCDAFAEGPFSGNPAAVCVLEGWLDPATLAAIAAENNLSETAYLVPCEEGADADFELRWFTPAVEVDLCGHATLASAWVVFERLGHAPASVGFSTRSGVLRASRAADRSLRIDLPAWPIRACADEALRVEISSALGAEVTEVFEGPYWIVLLRSEEDVRSLRPRIDALRHVEKPVVCTAAASSADCDFVSRFFGPTVGVDEDPVTGSAHCALAPLWGRRLGRQDLRARQLSSRGGAVQCTVQGDRVVLGGAVHPFMQGEITL